MNCCSCDAPASLRRKLERAIRDPQKAIHLNGIGDVFTEICDLAGVRIATFVESDRERVVAEVVSCFAGPRGAVRPEVDLKDGKTRNPSYRATHGQVRVAEPELAVKWALHVPTCD